jgi:hypothetical protein
MLKLSIEEIITKIRNEVTFDVVAVDNSFTLKIDNYVPYVCAAIHDGHQFRNELLDKCLHTEYERWYEEDPATKEMIQSHPIVIAGCDSRFEYDLNRDHENAVFGTAWGKKLWKLPLSKGERATSLQKHKNFYRVVEVLIEKLESMHGCTIVYDMHSYNWKRWDREVPTFNLGTSNVDNKRYGRFIELWRQKLSEIILPNGISSTSKINDTFFGNGYFLKFITSHFKNTLVLATEIKKIYCDELSGEIYQDIVSEIEVALKSEIPKHADIFLNNLLNE